MKEDRLTTELPVGELLGRFDRQERRALSSFGEFLVYKPFEVVIEEGAEQNCLYFLISGTLHAVHRVEEGATPLGTIQAGEWFGEINMFDPQTATAAVIAHIESHVWRMPRTGLEEFLNTYPNLGCQLILGIAEVLAKRMRKVINKINEIREAHG